MPDSLTILGLSAFYHDSAACLLRDGKLVAAAQEERFSRKKHDYRFPAHAVEYCLQEAEIDISAIDYVVFYDKPFLKFERLLESYLAYAPKGITSFLTAMPIWMRQKLLLKDLICKELNYNGEILFPEHHESHAASAFFPSPFREAALITADGVGEWATASYGIGRDNRVQILSEIKFPHSLGLLYSAFTYFTGFRVNSGEYKIMGLAPYGEPRYVDLIKSELIDIKDDGSFRLNLPYFNYQVGLTMTNDRFAKLFGGPPRKPETPITKREMDMARSIQVVTEEVMLKMAAHVHKETGARYLCLAGGVALNCVANGKILREGPFEDLWIQPASGDAGGALGAAYAIWHHFLDQPRKLDWSHQDKAPRDQQTGSYLGPEFSEREILAYLEAEGIPHERFLIEEIPRLTAELINSERVVGWFQGRMEFGPRALGSRSIIGDARSPKMQSVMNLKIKYRESFRPFAPTVRAEDVSEWFSIDRESPYMLLVADVHPDKWRTLTAEEEKLTGLAKLHVPRSEVPAITHVDFTARLQTVNKLDNPIYHAMITAFKELTGCPVIINTSFNVRGEPIVCSPEDAYRCFMRTEMDYLVMGPFILDKTKQPAREESPEEWQQEFPPD
ncbi:MAG: carbamoyltransferase [Candidatus Eisenbacteria bacterium]|uniref:Carbamoyltransferase n=1 Tax=Eiseniibacteriota bacterium TaxID=2212470 RepID=A0A948W3U3_UNCEI|nr:carbamoyltransferase [Candidatus Eisenbacteria bacterium]MBU1948956.1 carbamoyltransferase [Candidatus Eisenbacteria bacterium]MBU2691477.1 carbamoyltransferase [Candidatus Eisenbacteria bacterium]